MPVISLLSVVAIKLDSSSRKSLFVNSRGLIKAVSGRIIASILSSFEIAVLIRE